MLWVRVKVMGWFMVRITVRDRVGVGIRERIRVRIVLSEGWDEGCG